MDDQPNENPYDAPEELRLDEAQPTGNSSNRSLIIVLAALIFVASALFFPVLDHLSRVFRSSGPASFFMCIVMCWFFVIASGWAMLTVVALLSPLQLVVRTILGMALSLSGWCIWFLGTQAMEHGPDLDDFLRATSLFAAGVAGGTCVVSFVRFRSRWTLDGLTRVSEKEPTAQQRRLSIAEVLTLTAVMSVLFAAIRLGSRGVGTLEFVTTVLISFAMGATVTIPTLCSIGLMCGEKTKRLVTITIVLFAVTTACTLALMLYVFTNGQFSTSSLTGSSFVVWVASGIGTSALLFGVTFGYGKFLRVAGVQLVSNTAPAASTDI